MVVFARVARVFAVAVALFGPAMPAAWGQNLTAGKTAAQLFSQTCQTCHAKPQSLAGAAGRPLEGFMRQHYTTSKEDAALMAAYVRGLPADPAAAGRPGRTATTRPGTLPSEAPVVVPRATKSGEQARVPDDRAPAKRGPQQPQQQQSKKPDESRPVFDTSPPPPAVIPSIPETPPAAVEMPAPVPEPPAPTAQAPVRIEEPTTPAAEPAPMVEPAREPVREPAETAASPSSGAAPSEAPASEGNSKSEAE